MSSRKTKKKRQFLYVCINRHQTNQVYDTNRGFMCEKCWEKHNKTQQEGRKAILVV